MRCTVRPFVDELRSKLSFHIGQLYDEVVDVPFDLGENGEKVDATIEALRGLAKLGIQEAHGIVPAVWKITPLELIGARSCRLWVGHMCSGGSSGPPLTVVATRA